jgi:hypothetical protein
MKLQVTITLDLPQSTNPYEAELEVKRMLKQMWAMRQDYSDATYSTLDIPRCVLVNPVCRAKVFQISGPTTIQ